MAVLMVLWAHIPVAAQPNIIGKLVFVVQPGYFGVDLFFVLSGFLITRILLVDRFAGKPVGQFLVKRCLRIFPIYFLVVGILAIVDYGPYIKWCAVYLSNYYFGLTEPLPATPLNHTWSLAVEEHFYLVWPALVYLLPIKWVRAAAMWVIPLTAVGAAFATVYWLMPSHSFEIVYRGTQYRMFSLALGAAVACNEQWVRANIVRTLMVGGAFVMAGSVLFVGGKALDKPSLLHDIHIITKPISFSLISLGTLLGAIALAATPWRAVLANRVLSYIGKISYGIYLYHYVIFYYCHALPTSEHDTSTVVPMSRVALALALTFVIATVSYFVIEAPILRYKDRMFKPAASKGAKPSSPSH
ncbi:MAG: acyltransferase [Phycisphaerales bacterium]